MILDSLFTDFIFAALSSLGFAIIFNAPRSKILLCTLNGGIGWIIYMFVPNIVGSLYSSMFLASIVVSAISRKLSYRHNMPFTLFFIPSIMPLVPGGNMLNVMTGILENNMFYAFDQAVTALMFSGLIMAGFILIYLLPEKIFIHRKS